MKIVVPIKQVAKLHDGFEIVGANRVDPDFVEYELHEWDSFSLAAATDLAKGQADAEIVALTVGGDDSDVALREAIALGAGRAVRIDVSEEPEPDVLQVGRLVAEFARREDANLVLCGVQSADAATGATPSVIAGVLRWSRVTAAVGIETDGDVLSVRRELDGGSLERLAVELPAVLAVQSGAYEVPYPTMRAKMAAKRASIEVLMPEDVLDGADFAALRGSASLSFAPKVNSASAVTLEGRPSDVALAIKKILDEELA